MAKILVVDDDRNIVRLLKEYLQQAGFGVLPAFDAETAKALLKLEKPDLMVLDLGLPDGNGLDLTRQVRADTHLSTLPILMLTARVEDSDKIVGLEIGADDYITKPFNPREVVARVRAQLRRNQMGSAPAPLLSHGPLTLDVGRRTLIILGKDVDLTRTEFELLKLLMEHPGYTYHRDELLECALGYSFEGGSRTLDTHIKNLRRKIETDPKQPKYVETVHGVGYRFVRDAA